MTWLARAISCSLGFGAAGAGCSKGPARRLVARIAFSPFEISSRHPMIVRLPFAGRKHALNLHGARLLGPARIVLLDLAAYRLSHLNSPSRMPRRQSEQNQPLSGLLTFPLSKPGTPNC